MSLNDISLRPYLLKIKNIPQLNDEEEYELATKWKERGDKKALEKLVASHLKLVMKIANGYSGYGLAPADLIAEGNVGIMHAVQHFDPQIGYRFSTYAAWWIKSKIQEFIYNSWSIVRLSKDKDQRKLFYGLKKIKRKLGIETVSENNAQKIADELKVPKEKVLTSEMRFTSKDFSVNTAMGDDSTASWQDFIADERNMKDEISEKQEYEYRKKVLHQALNTLSRKEYEIFCSYHLKEPPQSFREIGKGLHISAERVRQIAQKAFLKMQKYIHNFEWQNNNKSRGAA